MMNEEEHFDEEQSEVEEDVEDEGLTNFLQLCETFSDEDHIEELKWLKNFLICQSGKMDLTQEGSLLIPETPELNETLKKDCFVKLLTYLDLEPPNDQQPYWKLQRIQMNKGNIERLADNVQYVIHLQIDKCKQCKIRFSSILQHLKKSAECSNVYSESDMTQLRQLAKMKSKEKRTEWRKKNKESLKAKEAERYQGRKKEMADFYQKNREQILQKRLNDYDRDQDKRYERKRRYYEKNKETIAQKYQVKKAKKLADKEKQWIERREREIKQRKENFANEKSAIRKSAKHFKTFWSDLYLENVVTFKKSILKNKRLANSAHFLSILDDLEKQIEAIYKDLDAEIEKVRSEEVSVMDHPSTIYTIEKKLEDFFNSRSDELKKTLDSKLREMAIQIKEKYNCPTCLMFRRFSTLGREYCDDCKPNK